MMPALGTSSEIHSRPEGLEQGTDGLALVDFPKHPENKFKRNFGGLEYFLSLAMFMQTTFKRIPMPINPAVLL